MEQGHRLAHTSPPKKDRAILIAEADLDLLSV